MSFGDRVGVLGAILTLVGIAASILWPDKKWLGWSSLGAAAILLALWGWLEIRPQFPALYSKYPIRTLISIFVVGGVIALCGSLLLIGPPSRVAQIKNKPPDSASPPAATKEPPKTEPSTGRIKSSHNEDSEDEAINLSQQIFDFLSGRDANAPEAVKMYIAHRDPGVIPIGNYGAHALKAYDSETVQIFQKQYDRKVARIVHELLDKKYPVVPLSRPAKTLIRIRSTAEILSLVDHPPEMKPMSEAIELSDLLANVWVDFDAKWNSIRAEYDQHQTSMNTYRSKLDAISREKANEYRENYKDRIIAVRREMLKQLPGTVDLTGTLLAEDSADAPSWVRNSPMSVDSYREIANDLNSMAEQYYAKLFGR